MNEIIAIGKHEFSGCQKQTVNARELHAFLGSKQDFSTWIKNRIDEYGFVENQDFAVFHNFVENPNGGRPRIEYALTLDMAKELSMVERTDKGKQARQYFIECERRAQSAPAIPQTLPEALRLAADLAEQNQQQQARLAIVEPKAAAFDVLSGRNDAYNITLVAKHLNMGRKDLIAYLRAHQWIYGKSPIMASAKAVKAGDMIQVNGTSERNGVDYTQALITSKGQAKLAQHFAGERQA